MGMGMGRGAGAWGEGSFVEGSNRIGFVRSFWATTTTMTRFFPITLRPVKSRPNLKQPQNKYRYGKTLLKKPKDKKKKKKTWARTGKGGPIFPGTGGKNKQDTNQTNNINAHAHGALAKLVKIPLLSMNYWKNFSLERRGIKKTKNLKSKSYILQRTVVHVYFCISHSNLRCKY